MVKALWLSVCCAAMLTGCSPSAAKKEVPDVADSAQLLSECQPFFAAAMDAPIPKEQWPDSVKKLDPVSIVHTDSGVLITTSTANGNHGYLIAFFKPANNPQYTLTDTPHPKIYRFDAKP